MITLDNGPQFVLKPFQDVLEIYDIQHRKVTPYWLQVNGEVEWFNRPLAAQIERKHWCQEIYSFLMILPATPHAVTGVTPLQLMVGREICTKVPQLRKPGMTKAFITAQWNDLSRKHQKLYADRCCEVVFSPMKEGNKVLLQQPQKDEFSTRYNHKPYTVVARNSPSVLVKHGNEPRIFRSIFLVRKLHKETVVNIPALIIWLIIWDMLQPFIS